MVNNLRLLLRVLIWHSNIITMTLFPRAITMHLLQLWDALIPKDIQQYLTA